MRVTLALLLLTTACASSGGGSNTRTTGTNTERRTTTVTYVDPRGQTININLDADVRMDTRSTHIPSTPVEIWRALPLAFNDVGIALAAYDSVQMYIGNPGLAISSGRLGANRLSRFLNCGSDAMTGPLADRYNVRLSVVSRVRPDPGGAVLETQVSAEAMQRGVSSLSVNCASTGQLEEMLANATKLRLAGGFPQR